jgi:hypothetical protein
MTRRSVYREKCMRSCCVRMGPNPSFNPDRARRASFGARRHGRLT